MTSCNSIASEIAALRADIAALNNKFAAKSDLRNYQNQIKVLEAKIDNVSRERNKYVQKSEFTQYKQYMENMLEGIRRGFEIVFKKLDREKAGYQEVFGLSDGLGAVRKALNFLERKVDSLPKVKSSQGLEERLGRLETRLNQNYSNDSKQDQGISSIKRKSDETAGELWSLRRDFNAAKLSNNLEHGKIWGAITGTQKLVQGLLAGIPALVKTILLSILASTLFNTVAQIVAQIIASKGIGDINSIRQLAQKAYNTAVKAGGDARAAATLAVKAEGKADIAKGIALKAQEEIKYVTERALAAMQRLEAFIKSEISFLTKSTLNALMRLQSRLGTLEGVVKEINNLAIGLIGQIQFINGKLNELQQSVATKIQGILSTVTDLKSIVAAIQVQFTGLQTEVNARIKGLTAVVNGLKINLENQLKNITATVEKIKADVENQLKNFKLDIGKIFGTLAALGVQIAGILLTIAGINALVNAFRPGGIVNNYFITNNTNNVSNIQQISPQDSALLRKIDATTTANLVTSKGNNIVLQTINGITSTTLGIVSSLWTTISVINVKMGGELIGGLSGWMTRFTTHQIVDRTLSILTFAATIHNATQLSSNIAVTLMQTMQNVVDFFGLKDSENKVYDITDIIGNGINGFLVAVLGAENLAGIKKEWNKHSRIYQSGANLFSSLMSMGDTMVNAVQIVSGQNAKIGNALKVWGVVGEKAYGWMNITPNFSNPLLTKLQSLEETASTVEQVSQEPLNVKAAKEDVEASSAALFDSLEQKENAPQGKEIPEAVKIKEAQEEAKAASTGKDVNPIDKVEDDS